MIVAAGAAERHAQERRCRRAEHVVELLVAIQLEFSRLVVPGAQPEKRGSNLRFSLGILDLVAGDLLGEKAVERLILVKGIDDVIAVTPSVWLGVVALVAVRLGVADHVEPMPCPTLAVLRPGQQLVHDFAIGFRRLILQKPPLFLGRRRQADQIEVDAPQQRPPIGRGRGPDSFFFQPRQNEAVDGRPHPSAIAHARQFRTADRLKRPVLRPLGFADALIRVRSQHGGRG